MLFDSISKYRSTPYVATVYNNDTAREKVIVEWGNLYKRSFSKEDIKCFGCKSDTLFGLCARCDIRICNAEKGIANCEDCITFPCERIKRFFDFHKAHATGNVFD